MMGRLRTPGRRSAALLGALIAGMLSCAPSTAPDRPPVIVIGIDGGTWDVIDPLLAAGELPTLQRLRDSGIHGVLESRVPMYSPVVWTTIFTGQLPEAHGITDWSGAQQLRREVAAVWDATRAHGRSTCVLNVPGTWPPEPVDGVMVSGFPFPGMTVGGSDGSVTSIANVERRRVNPTYYDAARIIARVATPLAPGDWTDWVEVPDSQYPGMPGVMRVKRLDADRLYLSPIYRTLSAPAVTYPDSLRASLRGRAGAPYVPEGPGWRRYADPAAPGYLAEHLTQVFDGQTRLAVSYAAESWDLFIHVMTLVDRVSHAYWSYYRPDDFPRFATEIAEADPSGRFTGEVEEAYRRVDRGIAEVLAAAPSNAYVIVVSDHGFQPSTRPDERAGRHHTAGIYMLSGPGIPPGDGGVAPIESIGPTILHLLDMPVSEEMTGSVMAAAVTATGREVQTVPSYERGQRAERIPGVDAAIREQLRGLGYLGGGEGR